MVSEAGEIQVMLSQINQPSTEQHRQIQACGKAIVTAMFVNDLASQVTKEAVANYL